MVQTKKGYAISPKLPDFTKTTRYFDENRIFLLPKTPYGFTKCDCQTDHFSIAERCQLDRY